VDLYRKPFLEKKTGSDTVANTECVVEEVKKKDNSDWVVRQLWKLVLEKLNSKIKSNLFSGESTFDRSTV
jgi:5-methylthioribose kinase